MYQTIGRLAPARRSNRRAAEMDAIAGDIAREHPDSNAGWGVTLVPAHEQVVGNIGRTLWVLFGAVVLVLLIACANIANLLLARSARDVARFRGARRVRRQPLGAGAPIAGRERACWRWRAAPSAWRSPGSGHPRVAAADAARRVPRADGIGLDLAGRRVSRVADRHRRRRPVRRSCRRGARCGRTCWTSLQEGGRRQHEQPAVPLAVGRDGRRPKWRWRWCSSSAPASCSAASSGSRRSIRASARRASSRCTSCCRDARYRGGRAEAAVLRRPAGADARRSRRSAGQRGVRAADEPARRAVRAAPSRSTASKPRRRPSGRAPRYRGVMPGYFEAMAIPLREGRTFDRFDGREDGPSVAIVNETLARRYFGDDESDRSAGEDADGRRPARSSAWSADIRHDGLQAAAAPRSSCRTTQSGALADADRRRRPTCRWRTPRPRAKPALAGARSRAAVRQDLDDRRSGVGVDRAAAIQHVAASSGSRSPRRLLAAVGVYGLVTYCGDAPHGRKSACARRSARSRGRRSAGRRARRSSWCSSASRRPGGARALLGRSLEQPAVRRLGTRSGDLRRGRRPLIVVGLVAATPAGRCARRASIRCARSGRSSSSVPESRAGPLSLTRLCGVFVECLPAPGHLFGHVAPDRPVASELRLNTVISILPSRRFPSAPWEELLPAGRPRAAGSRLCRPDRDGDQHLRIWMDERRSPAHDPPAFRGKRPAQLFPNSFHDVGMCPGFPIVGASRKRCGVVLRRAPSQFLKVANHPVVGWLPNRWHRSIVRARFRFLPVADSMVLTCRRSDS